jgi:hypothetical protein
MGTSADAKPPLLASGNTPAALWKLLDDSVTEEEWDRAARAALPELDDLPAASAGGPRDVVEAVLTESQFGPRHWELGPARRGYYALRPLLPAAARAWLRKRLLGRGRPDSPLGWPVEDRYVRWQKRTVAELLRARGVESLPHVGFWPHGKRFAFVLTHDVEGPRGQRFARELAALEERLGFRSSFNFVPELYEVDASLLEDLRARGFEVGVHGLRHDGRLFSSRDGFAAAAPRINDYVARWDAAGFRSPMTHRQPYWMQDLAVEYDLSFFDTDPFEPIGGGTMSIWPFRMGRFVELPYTLVQDHTLMVTLGETSARLWLEKLEFVAANGGMALLNSHPDYLREPRHLAIYEELLGAVARRDDAWRALPRDAARWWRARSAATARRDGGSWTVEGLPGAAVGRVQATEGSARAVPACEGAR